MRGLSEQDPGSLLLILMDNSKIDIFLVEVKLTKIKLSFLFAFLFLDSDWLQRLQQSLRKGIHIK